MPAASKLKVPADFQEHFIHSGYRPCHQPWSYYLSSALRLHNETFNFWTHAASLLLLAANLFFRYLPKLDTADPISWPFLVGYTACSCMFLASAAAHLLHSKSRRVHQLAFMADYAGIGLFGIGTSLPHLFYVSTDAFFARWEGVHLEIMAALALLSCLLGSYFKVRERATARRLTQSSAILLMYLWSMAPAALRYLPCLHNGSCELGDQILQDHLLQLGSLFLAAAFYGSHLPEAIWPGRFDIIGHSHQIFHIFIYLNMHFGAEAAFGHLRQLSEAVKMARRPSSLSHLIWPIAIVVAAETAIIATLNRISTHHPSKAKKAK